MRVEIAELRAAVLAAIDHIDELNVESVELDADYYWFIQADDVYDPYDEPTNLTMGQLSDDLDRMRRILAEPDFVVSYDLVRLSALVRAVGERVLG